MSRTFADLQRDPRAGTPAGPAALPLDVQQVRTFDTPEFAGMTFHEVEAKSALNRVRGMPFEWSVNPYRGCSHACSYCLAGDTPVLMADGGVRALAAVRPGDRVCGTQWQGGARRYVATTVLDHWSTLEPGYRVDLEDGTQLVASGDHRFLTDHGWRHVSGGGVGPCPRPHLTTAHRLVGVGGFAQPPKKGAEYQRGYLCAVLRAGAQAGSSTCVGGGLGLDEAARERARGYLQAAGIRARDGDPLAAVRTPATPAGGAERGPCLGDWPATPCGEWGRGFAAGLVDAAGRWHGGVLEVHHRDGQVLAWLLWCLDRLGMPGRCEAQAHRDGCRAVRVAGGIRQRLRFAHATDPATARQRGLDGFAVGSDGPLAVVGVEPLGVDLPMYDITTGTGDFVADGVVSHNCFARPTHEYLNLSPLGDFEKVVVVKTNVADVLRRELAKPSWTGDRVALGTNTDPYQRCEGRYALMPEVIRAFADGLTPFSILTKGTLILRDLDALTSAAERVPVSTAFTVGMLDRTVWRSAEPGTPSPQARLHAVRLLAEAGLPTGVMLAPIMPGINDDAEQLDALVDACAAAGAGHITPIVLHLRPGVRELFMPWLARAYPELVGRYESLYRRAEAAATYRDEVVAFVRERRRAAWRRHGRPPPPPQRRSAPAQAPPQPRQLGLLDP